jgi:hypothetical protein
MSRRTVENCEQSLQANAREAHNLRNREARVSGGRQLADPMRAGGMLKTGRWAPVSVLSARGLATPAASSPGEIPMTAASTRVLQQQR